MRRATATVIGIGPASKGTGRRYRVTVVTGPLLPYARAYYFIVRGTRALRHNYILL